MTFLNFSYVPKCLIFSFLMVFITSPAWSFVVQDHPNGEMKMSREIRTIVKKNEKIESSNATLKFTYTELESTNLAIIYDPLIAVMPLFPTALSQYIIDFDTSYKNQEFLCGLLGYIPLARDLKSKSFTNSKITSEVNVSTEDDKLNVYLQAVSHSTKMGPINRSQSIIIRLVCVK